VSGLGLRVGVRVQCQGSVSGLGCSVRVGVKCQGVRVKCQS
jgi:hypothetical protein